jgi:hypothetical protein
MSTWCSRESVFGVRHAEFEILDTNLYKNGLFLGEIARYQLEVRRFYRIGGAQRLVAWKLRRK